MKILDSGFDLIVPDDYEFHINETKLVDFKVSCVLFSKNENKCLPSYLYPLSSIYKSDFIMMNNTGIIDSGYRGKY